ncbi:4'-phosphopantetheinyl transferase family protein [Actinokineospora iranica]|uniref:4'-phosphopantetheinyl transferase n=1 Tax=Actinokineospora iranica TaxID=1271860 RepID=A0A1G6W6T5_9PSEU|nr:4'-phosphopantetheinyl transferase superfamily protein [Actinokineospora iranica]SDD61562.1 4'-phosphopantetheinyl transferase [Actinokineospora iranica]
MPIPPGQDRPRRPRRTEAAPAVIGADEAHIWVLDPHTLAMSDLVSACRDLLSDDERARVRRRRFDRDRHTALAAHALARTALSWCAPEIHPEEWVLGRTEHDRPEVRWPIVLPPLRFNVSHTDRLIACVVTSGIACGIDVEVVDRETDVDLLARNICTPAEFASLAGLPDIARRARFFRYWTLKEAYTKARGLGLSVPFERHGFDWDSGPIRLRVDGPADAPADDPEHWQFAQWPVTDRHILAVALRTGAAPDRRVIRHPTPTESSESDSPGVFARWRFENHD